MAKITEESRALFNKKSAPYKELIKKINDKEKQILEIINQDEQNKGYKKMMLAEDMIYFATVQMIINNLSVVLLDTKNEDSLNDARKALYKAIIYLEETVSNYIDAAYSEYEEKVAQIANISFEKRYFLIRKLGLAISMIMDAYGANTKWKWAFVELQGRFAAVAKNIVDLTETAKNYFDSRSADYDNTVYYFRMLKKLLEQSGDGYRNRYELSTKRMDDIRLAINYINALRRILLILDERDNAEEAKKKAAVWKAKMDAEHKTVAK